MGTANRQDDLLVGAANNLKQGMNPMHHEWLVEHGVTFDECMNLAEQIATAIHVYRSTFKLALRNAELQSKKERTLAEVVWSMALREAGPMGIIVEASRLEDEAGEKG